MKDYTAAFSAKREQLLAAGVEMMDPSSVYVEDTVTVGGQSYSVASTVPCYNRDTRTWVSLQEAHAYAQTSTLYVSDGIVRVIEVGQ